MAKINFLPTRDWLVLPYQKQNETEAGILLSDAAAHTLRTNILEVLAAGPKCEMVKEGDIVMVHPTSEGLIIEIEEKQYVMVNEFMICGIIPQ
jgi:co-chaperonin GroES (HSP10)